MYDYKHFTVAVDFDNTCVVAGKVYPEIAGSVPGAASELAKLAAFGVRIVLWTCRVGKELDAARKWFEDNGIPLFGVNHNPDPYWIENPTRKIYADVYVDDKGLNMPTITINHQKCVDWNEAGRMILEEHERWYWRHFYRGGLR